MTNRTVRAAALLVLAALAAAPASAQFAERREYAGAEMKNIDASGRSPKDYRVRAIHTETITRPGGTQWVQLFDPFLGYQIGRNLNFREFRERDGVLSDMQQTVDVGIGNLGGPMPDGVTAKLTLQNHVSCIACHNVPNGNPGGGVNIAKDSGFGRKANHYFGTGLIEMLALQARTDILLQVDTNGDGWISVAESQAAPASVTVVPTPGGTPLDFGNPQLDGGATGSPQLNNIIRVWYVDGDGEHVPGATSVDGVTTFGYNFVIVVYGWGQGAGRDALNPTTRFFLTDPFVTHFGLEAFDPTTTDDPEGDGVSRISNLGAVQFPATHMPPDQGPEVSGGFNWGGYSLADPDGDGYCTEISEGDLDFGEMFMLNLPAPAFAGTQAEYDAGVALLEQMACTTCHVETWTINAADGTYDGDRRFFDLDVTWNDATQRLEGELNPLFELLGVGGDLIHQVKLKSFEVKGLFSDLRHHDMGEGFQEIGYDGTINDVWRTQPLWGTGTHFPWGHDGRSLTLEDVILRHDGEGAASKAAYLAATAQDQDDLIAFLRKLVLYDIESLPTDMDGDGVISENFVVAGKLTGVERFNAEWMFDDPLQIQGTYVNDDGEISFSWAGINIEQAYKLEMQYRDDNDEEDGDGWPDEWDDEPYVIGWYDGVNNPPWWVDPVSGKN